MENNNLNEKSGIKGWLLLLAIGIVIAPLSAIYGILLTTGQLWGSISKYYQQNPQFLSFLRFELALFVLVLISSIYFLVIFFKKKKAFVKGYITFLIVMFVVYIFHEIWSLALTKEMAKQTLEIFSGLSSGQENQTIKDTLTALQPTSGNLFKRGIINVGTTAFGAILWIFYLLKSKKVKNTFTR